MPNQTKRRTSSRTRAKKASTTKGLVTPATQNKSNKTLSDDFDAESVHSDATAHTKNQGSPTKEELAELEAFETEMAAKHAQEANEAKATSIKDRPNTHSAQAKLNASLDPNSYQSRLQQLQTQALAKRDKILNKASESKSAKKSKKSTTKSSKKTSKPATKPPPSAKTIEASDESDTESDNSNDDDKKSKTPKSKSTNYYSSLKTKPSQMSVSERKQYKSVQRKFRTYCGLKIDIPSNDDPMATLVKQTANLFAEIQKIDSKAIIYAYNDRLPMHSIPSPKDIPSSFALYKGFFFGAQSRSDKGIAWCSIWLGHEKPIQEILIDMGQWSRLHGSRVFEKTLQIKHTKKEYFLLWSNGRMDKDTLLDATHSAIATLTDKKYNFAFAWTALKGVNGKFLHLAKKEPNGNTLVKALHIEVPSDERDQTYKMLEMIFGLDSQFEILNCELLMVPIIRPDIPGHKIENIQHLIIKQKQFLDKMCYGKTFDFTEIDYLNPALKLTMRDMIMQLVTLDGTATKLFWSLDLDSYDNSYCLTYPKFLDAHARDIISQLPSLLCWIYGPEALTMMTDAAQDRAREAPWDPKTMCALSKEDKALAAMRDRAKSIREYTDADALSSDDDDDMDYTQMEFDMQSRETDAFLFKKASSNQSVDTLGTKPTSSKTTRDDDSLDNASISAKPSPTKKQKATATSDTTHDENEAKIQKMFQYFEMHNIDINTLEVSSVVNATRVATSGLHESTDMDTSDDAVVNNTNDSSATEQDREPSQSEMETPGPVTGLGEGL